MRAGPEAPVDNAWHFGEVLFVHLDVPCAVSRDPSGWNPVYSAAPEPHGRTSYVRLPRSTRFPPGLDLYLVFPNCCISGIVLVRLGVIASGSLEVGGHRDLLQSVTLE